MTIDDDEYGPRSTPTTRPPPPPLFDLNAVGEEDEKEEETKILCPACRALMPSCAVCGGTGSLTVEQYTQWKILNP